MKFHYDPPCTKPYGHPNNLHREMAHSLMVYFLVAITAGIKYNRPPSTFSPHHGISFPLYPKNLPALSLVRLCNTCKIPDTLSWGSSNAPSPPISVLTQPGSRTIGIKSGRSRACLYVLCKQRRHERQKKKKVQDRENPRAYSLQPC